MEDRWAKRESRRGVKRRKRWQSRRGRGRKRRGTHARGCKWPVWEMPSISSEKSAEFGRLATLLLLLSTHLRYHLLLLLCSVVCAIVTPHPHLPFCPYCMSYLCYTNCDYSSHVSLADILARTVYRLAYTSCIIVDYRTTGILRRVYRYISSQKWHLESILYTSWWDKNL